MVRRFIAWLRRERAWMEGYMAAEENEARILEAGRAMLGSDKPPHTLPADQVCRHGVATDVHCCGCHSGFLFEGGEHDCQATIDERRADDEYFRSGTRYPGQ